MKLDLPPVKARALAVRSIAQAAPDLAAALGLPPDRRSLALITATSDDALFASLDQGTKASSAEVVYARSFYAGAAHPSGPLSGECLGIYAAGDPAEIDAAVTACLAYLENEAWFYGVTLAPGSGGGRGGRRVLYFPHVIASLGRYLAPLAGVPVGSAMAYLIAPPLESVVAIDAACKAATVRLAKWFGPPSETNFGGGYLVGEQPACEAAARAFAAAVIDVCQAPISTRNPERVPDLPRWAPTAKPSTGDSTRNPQRVPDLPRWAPTAKPSTPDAHPAAPAPAPFQALETGQRFASKPDHLTHLVDNASLVAKTHPRIVLRGKIDQLQSAILDAQVAADDDQVHGLVGELGELLELSRGLIGAEVTGRPLAPFTLFGMSPDQVRDATHHTSELYGVPFMYPDVRQGPVVSKLGLARGMAREAELAALLAFAADEGDGDATAPPTRPDLCQALNRISSALYLLTCKYVAGRYDGSRRPKGPVRGWRPPQ